MARVKFVKPIEDLNGKLNTPKEKDGSIFVVRQKCFGTTKRGMKILGPKESYVIHRHEGKWSVGATENRKRFSDAQKQAYAELRDPARKAYWQELFEEQLEHPVDGKRYVKLPTFVAAKIREQG